VRCPPLHAVVRGGRQMQVVPELLHLQNVRPSSSPPPRKLRLAPLSRLIPMISRRPMP
jgi:hypothetical protein